MSSPTTPSRVATRIRSGFGQTIVNGEPARSGQRLTSRHPSLLTPHDTSFWSAEGRLLGWIVEPGASPPKVGARLPRSGHPPSRAPRSGRAGTALEGTAWIGTARTPWMRHSGTTMELASAGRSIPVGPSSRTAATARHRSVHQVCACLTLHLVSLELWRLQPLSPAA